MGISAMIIGGILFLFSHLAKEKVDHHRQACKQEASDPDQGHKDLTEAGNYLIAAMVISFLLALIGLKNAIGC